MPRGSISRAGRVMAAFIASLMGGTAAVASVPPPPPAYIDELAKQIVPTQTVETFDRYASSIADDVTVSVDGKQVAASKTAWIAVERHRLGKVDRHVLGYVEGYDSILVIDRFDDRSDLPTSPNMLFDPRYKTRALQYQFGADHLIHAIRIVQEDGIIQTSP
jgi:hypothetical protein